MLISLSWLRDYVDAPISADDLADRITMAGLEVEELSYIGNDFDGIVIGRVDDVRKHPNADRLSVCRVDVGGNEPLSIVCGAPNVAEGQRVPVAVVGAELMVPAKEGNGPAQPFKIGKRKMRGEVSEGMICSEWELGLSENHDGILVLPEDAPIGKPFGEYQVSRGAPAADTVIEIAVTPNRPDATSHFGVARDVAALTGSRFERPEVEPIPLASDAPVSISIDAPEACRRYVGIVVRGLTVAESPEWLKHRLTAIGLRPLNNVVDITNYVMFECGQPLHAFDLAQLKGPEIRVRLSDGGESFTTLDSRTHQLPEGALLICDAERPVALAGIMGGENSEVSGETVDILIESAYFDPSVVRRTAKRLGIQSDSSYRFERGIDSSGQVWAATRAARLIQELAGGTIDDGVVDVHPNPVPERRVSLRPERVAKLLGIEIPTDVMIELLTSIGFGVDRRDGMLECVVPPFRPDVEREVDLIEEVARLYGYDRMPEPAHSRLPNIVPTEEPAARSRREVMRRLAALGFHEVHTNSMLRRDTAERYALPFAGDAASVVETLNPISREMSTLRPSLLPGVLQVTSFNEHHGLSGLAFFEFGHVFARSSAADNIISGYRERDHLLILATGPVDEVTWNSKPRNADFYDAKGIVDLIAEVLGISDVTYEVGTENIGISDSYVRVMVGGQWIGYVGILSPAIATEYDLDSDVVFAELDWRSLTDASTLERTFNAIPRYPTSVRDLAITVGRDQAAGLLLDAIRESAGPLLRDVTLFDLYEGDRIAADKRSLAFSLVFGADRTLTDSEVDAAVEAVSRSLKDRYGADLRR